MTPTVELYHDPLLMPEDYMERLDELHHGPTGRMFHALKFSIEQAANGQVSIVKVDGNIEAWAFRHQFKVAPHSDIKYLPFTIDTFVDPDFRRQGLGSRAAYAVLANTTDLTVGDGWGDAAASFYHDLSLFTPLITTHTHCLVPTEEELTHV